MKVKRIFFTFVIFSIISAGLWSQEAEVEAEADVETPVTNLYNLEDLLSATQMNHP